VVCAKHDVLQQIADATTAAGATASSSSRRPSGRRSMDGSSTTSSSNGAVMSAPSTLSATADYSFPDADAAATAAAAARTATASDSSATSSGRSSRRTQSMDLAKMLSGGWNPVTGTDKQNGESLLTVVADVADEETAEPETVDAAVTSAAADREPAHSTDTESKHVVVPLPPAATTATADAGTAAGATAGVSPPAVPASGGSNTSAGTTVSRKRSDVSLATDTYNSSSSSSLRINSSMFSSGSGAPATPSRSAGPYVSSLVQARTAAEAEAASKRAAAVSERLASAQYKESGAQG
jgi:peptidoglycan DL-endopeptidase CwlO